MGAAFSMVPSHTRSQPTWADRWRGTRRRQPARRHAWPPPRRTPCPAAGPAPSAGRF